MKTAQANTVALGSKIGMAVEKRSGELVPFNVNKIIDAIALAMKASGEVPASKLADSALHVAYDVTVNTQRTHQVLVSVEWLQDEVEKTLMAQGYTETAKAYILYRTGRAHSRNAEKALSEMLDEIIFSSSMESDLKRGNANVDGNTAMGTILQIGAAASKQYYTAKFLKPQHAKAHQDGLIHIHDFDFYSLTTTCCQIDIEKLFTGGFSTGHGELREPSTIRAASALACIAIQANQNDQHGGQSIPNFDYALGKYVRKSFAKHLGRQLATILRVSLAHCSDSSDVDRLLKGTYYERIKGNLSPMCEAYCPDFDDELADGIAGASSYQFEHAQQDIALARKIAYRETERETYQAMEAFVHNMNSMHSRAGAQVPFSSVNYGTDTTIEGRMVVRNLLLATEAGLGRGETPIFPIQVFKVKEGVNYSK